MTASGKEEPGLCRPPPEKVKATGVLFPAWTAGIRRAAGGPTGSRPHRGALLAAALLASVCPSPVPAGAQVTPPGTGGYPSPALVTGPTGLALGVEATLHTLVDELVSPLRYSGFSIGPGLRWGFSSSSGIRNLTASYGAPRLTSSATRKGSHFQEGHRFDARLVLLQRVASVGHGRVSLYLGGTAAGRFALYHHWYTREEKESWMHAFGILMPGFGWSAELPWGGQLWQDLALPLVGIALRPGYEGLTKVPEAEWVGVGDVRGLDLALHYQQPMGRRFRLGFTYDFNALRYPEPQPVAGNRQSFNLFVTLWEGGGG